MALARAPAVKERVRGRVSNVVTYLSRNTLFKMAVHYHMIKIAPLNKLHVNPFEMVTSSIKSSIKIKYISVTILSGVKPLPVH